MEYQIYRLEFLTGVHFGSGNLEDAEYHLHADTIFSALCQEYLKTKSKDLSLFIEKVRQGKILLSDAFPYIGEELYIPKPMKRVEVDEKAGDSQIKKAYKKLNYIPITKLDQYLKGNLDVMLENENFHEFGRSEVRDNVSIRGEEETRPYRTGIYYFNDNCGLYIIIGYEEEEESFLMADLFTSLSYTGLGGKRNSGLGRFKEPRFVKIPSAFEKRLLGKYDQYMALSVCLPKESEMEEALKEADYKLKKRSGFVQSSDYSNEQRRKNDLFVFQAGSCFEHKFEGEVYDVADGGTHPVYRYAKSMLMGV